ncbi:DUF262 domain-containing protein [uncultured Shewanella sp.]|uniref:DUF262 domain-containing protein n=1 Tax=uncultured Shewanella sp. TaxID=173975 RepID=UPI0026398EAC|nr:DUF262 domain-containing protein [uncultured Shewanella sp.]
MPKLEEAIALKRNSLKTDRLDMSFGELMNMFEDGDLFISPEYQRVFRWSIFQQTRFIESVLLGIPIPPVFVAEDDDGRWEVVDGLQRISSIFAFFGLLESLPEKNNSILTQGELVNELENTTISTLPLKLKTTIKRSVCRVEIVKWDSQEDIRYELFNRLNTGASPLSEQEIRNCIFRGYKVDLNSILKKVAKKPEFIEIISPSDSKLEQMFLEELALRFFAFKNLEGDFKTTVPQFLSEFMKSVSNASTPFDLNFEENSLNQFIEYIASRHGKSVFRPKGNFALHIFDSLAYALPKTFGSVIGNEDAIDEKIGLLLNDTVYNSIGTSTFSTGRIRKRMDRALEIFKGDA